MGRWCKRADRTNIWINDWIRKKYRERRATKRHARLPTRLEALLRAEGMDFWTQEYFRRQQRKLLEAGLRRSEDELVYEDSEDHRYPRLLKKIGICKNGARRSSEIQTRTDGTRGRSRVQPRTDCARRWNMFTAHHLRRPGSDGRPALSAARQALSEHAKDVTPLRKQNHLLYNVDVLPPSGLLSWWCSGSELQRQTSVSP